MKGVALLAVAALWLAPGAAAQRGDVAKGKTLYAGACASCHGGNAEGNVSPGPPSAGARGIPGAGPPLRGVGAQAADFYLRTGYMPLSNPDNQPRRGKPGFPPDELRAIVAYIASFGGPAVPVPHPERGNLSQGLHLFTDHCAGCHQVAAEGGVVTDSLAPSLNRATPTQIAEAVRIGPYVMPAFPKSQISDAALDSIIRYVQYAKNPDDRGGWALGHIGPIPEGVVAWLIAGAALIAVALVIGRRAKTRPDE